MESTKNLYKQIASQLLSSIGNRQFLSCCMQGIHNNIPYYFYVTIIIKRGANNDIIDITPIFWKFESDENIMFIWSSFIYEFMLLVKNDKK